MVTSSLQTERHALEEILTKTRIYNMNANNKENKVLLQCTPTPLSLFMENIKVETSRIESKQSTKKKSYTGT